MPAEDILEKIKKEADIYSGSIRHFDAVKELLDMFCELNLEMEIYMDQYVYPFQSKFFSSQALKTGRNLIINTLSPEFGNRFIEKTQYLVVVTMHNDVQYMFLTHCIKLNDDSEPAITLEYPYVLKYHRSREYFRAEIPVHHGLMAIIPLKEEGNEEVISAPIIDISFGGFSFVVPDTSPTLETERTISGVKFILPVEGQVETGIIIRNSVILENDELKGKRKYGVQFMDMTNEQLEKIKRYNLYLLREDIIASAGNGV